MTATIDVRPMLVGGTWRTASSTIEVSDPESGRVLGAVPAADARDAADALAAAGQAAQHLRRTSPQFRAAALRTMADRVLAESETFATTIAEEGIKTIRESRREVERCIRTLRLSADEAGRTSGEVQQFDAEVDGAQRTGFWVREPIGIVVAFTPFNDPLNLVAHKVGPAIAVGAPIIVKPDERTPFSALLLAVAAEAAGLPLGSVQVLTGYGATLAKPLVDDARVGVVSFTGGPVVGSRIARLAAGKTFIAELGNNGAVIVLEDCDLDDAVGQITSGAFAAAGQNCLHVQRVLVEHSRYDGLRERLAAATSQVRLGAKLDPATDMGPLITERAADRVQMQIDRVRHVGARVLNGGTRRGTLVEPTLLERVPRADPLHREEVFGPVTLLEPIASLAEGIEEANRGGSGLQAAVFTSSVASAAYAFEHLDTGSVVVNDSTDFRDDSMPFGSAGGVGREGVRFACESLTAPKLSSTRVKVRDRG